MQKDTDGAIPNFRKTNTEFTKKNYLLIFLGRIFQVKGQSKKVINFF
jgi:hypothetical protein